MDLTDDQRLEYLRSVWATFQAKAETERGWSSSEYDLAYRWLARDFPLRVVERGIREFQGRPRRLEATARSVERAYGYYAAAVRLKADDTAPNLEVS